MTEVRYPNAAKTAKAQGKIDVQFTVDKNGNVINPMVSNSLGHGLDEEAIRVVKRAKFTPGFKHGKPVNTRMTIPFVFKLLDVNSSKSDKGQSNDDNEPGIYVTAYI